jgi:hypothetical protein
LPKAEDLTDADAVPLYERAVQAMPRGITQDQVREWLDLPPDERAVQAMPRSITEDQVREWLDLPPERLPQQQAEDMVQKYMESLKLVVQATKCKQCKWPDWQPDDGPPNLSSYRELAFVIRLWARLEISRAEYKGALAVTQTGFGMARHLEGAPTIIHGLVGVAVGALMCGEIEQFIQRKDSPNLYAAMAELPRPLIDMEKAIEKEKAHLKDFDAATREELEKQLKTTHDWSRLVARRLDNRVNALQAVEAIRHYAAAHDGQLPQALGDIKDIAVPNDLMSGKAFEYRRTATGAALQSAIPDGGNERDAVHYQIVLRK